MRYPNEYPYALTATGLNNAQKYYVREGIEVALQALMEINANFATHPNPPTPENSDRGYIYLENLKFVFSATTSAGARAGYGMMNGIYGLLVTLPQNEEIKDKTHLAMICSYFGNGSKKKIEELATPAAIIAWVANCPVEVLTFMGYKLPASRVPAAVAEPKKEPVKETKAMKIKSKIIAETVEDAVFTAGDGTRD